MLPNVGWFEMMMLLGLAVLLFGKRLPEVGRSLGKGIVEFKKGLSGAVDEFDISGTGRSSWTSGSSARTTGTAPAESTYTDQSVPKFELPGTPSTSAAGRPRWSIRPARAIESRTAAPSAGKVLLAQGFCAVGQPYGLSGLRSLLIGPIGFGLDQERGTGRGRRSCSSSATYRPYPTPTLRLRAVSIGSAKTSIRVSIELRPTYVTSAEISTRSPT